MSRTQITTDLALQLITSITGIDNETDPVNFALCRDFTLKNFRTHAFLSADPFAVKDRLEGLEEKFRVLNHETLADELSALVQEYKASGAPLQPEALMLLLELSSNPLPRAAEILIELQDIKEASEQANQDDSFTRWRHEEGQSSDVEEDIWKPVDFTAGSSESEWDDEDGEVFAKISKERKPKGQVEFEADPDEDLPKEVEKYVNFVSRKPMDDLIKSQHWETQVSLSPKELAAPVLYGLTVEEKEDYFVLTELQVVRELIFQLNGLPNSLFTVSDGCKVTVNPRYILRHASAEGFVAMLEWFGQEGANMFNIRKVIERYNSTSDVHWSRRRDWPASMQTLIAELERSILMWQAETLVPLEERFVVRSEGKHCDINASLLGLQEQLEPSLRRIRILSGLATELLKELDTYGALSFAHMELLYRKACELQSVGDAKEYEFIARMFFPILNTYLRPVIRWMHGGELSNQVGSENFFIECKDDAALAEEGAMNENWLKDLWHDKYVLNREASGKVLAPEFLEAHVQKILVTGKSVLFLQRLRKESASLMMSKLPTSTEIKLTYESACGKDTSLSPFDEIVHSAISGWLDVAHKNVSDELRNILCYDCGLWDSLDALTNLYFMRDGHALNAFAVALFDKLDRNLESWDDRFLLTELLHSTYLENPHVEITRASIRSIRQSPSSHLLSKRRRLKAQYTDSLILDYRLSWPVMNVINSASIKTYQKIWSFMLMIKRALSGLEKLRIRKLGEEDVSLPNSMAFYNLRWKLLVCTNAIHRYLTDLVLCPGSEAIKQSLLVAEDVDSMANSHAGHIDKIRDLCLLGPRLATFYETIVSILDLALLFTDISRSTADGSVPEYLSKRSRGRRRARQWRKKRTDSDSEDDSSSGSDSDAPGEAVTDAESESVKGGDEAEAEAEAVRTLEPEDSGDDEGDTTLPIQEEGQSHEQYINSISSKFDELHAFLVAGLRSLARAGVHPESLDILADFLETGGSAS